MIPDLAYAATGPALVLAIYGASAAGVSGFKNRRDFLRFSERPPFAAWLRPWHRAGYQVAT